MNEFFEIVFGEGITVYQLWGYAWFFGIGYLIYGLTETTGRDKNSMNTPRTWSWRFWIADNWRRYLVTLLTTYVLFRFYTEISGHPFGYFDAVTMGMIGDGIGVTIKKRVMNSAKERQKLMSEYNENNEEVI